MMMIVRDEHGRFMVPTSKNREDAAIPVKGRPSRILVKNLLEGDRFCLAGRKRPGKVVSVRHGKDNFTKFEVQIGDKTFTSARPTQGRAWIVETPKMRRLRRAMSRLRSQV